MSDVESRPTPIDGAEWVADPHACLGRHRAAHWWAPFKGMSLAQVLEYRAVRELLSAGGQLQAYDGGFIEDVMRRNLALSEEHIQFMRDATARSLINIDGQEHERLRALVGRAFTPRAVAALAPYTADLARCLAARLEPGDDFMQTFAREFPASVVCRMLGVPVEDHNAFASWIDVLEVQSAPANLLKLDAEQAAEVHRVQLELHAYILELVRDRRAAPGDDLISRLVHDAEGDVGDDALVQLISDINFAANATTRNAIGRMVMALVSHPEVWEAVAAEPERAPAVVEEALRLHGPTPGPVRRACGRFEYRDHTFEDGDVAALSIWSANRDESFWGADAGEFDAERERSGEHLTFGHGPHFCLGAALARELLRAALIALTSRLTQLSLSEEPRMLPYGGVYGPISLKVAFAVRSA